MQGQQNIKNMDFGVCLVVTEPHPQDCRTHSLSRHCVCMWGEQFIFWFCHENNFALLTKLRKECHARNSATNRPAAVDIFISLFSNSLSLRTSAFLILFLSSSRLFLRMLSALYMQQSRRCRGLYLASAAPRAILSLQPPSIPTALPFICC